MARSRTTQSQIWNKDEKLQFADLGLVDTCVLVIRSFKLSASYSATKNPKQRSIDMENAEGEREIDCTWEIILHLGKGEKGMDMVTER